MENLEEIEDHHKEGQDIEKLNLWGTNAQNWNVSAKMKKTRRNVIITSRGMKGSPVEYEE